jgi:hypothetical protein
MRLCLQAGPGRQGPDIVAKEISLWDITSPVLGQQPSGPSGTFPVQSLWDIGPPVLSRTG